MKALDPWTLALGGTKLIEASAGTGKTHTLTTLYLRMLVEQDLRPAEILVVTYTNAAAAELRDRVRDRIRRAIAIAGDASHTDDDEPLRELVALARKRQGERAGPDPLRRALQEFDEAAIFTIHGFCQRTLQENAFESGVAFGAELVEQSELLERTLAHDLWSRLLEDEDPSFVAWLLRRSGRHSDFDPETLRRSLIAAMGADDEMPIVPTATEGSPDPDVGAMRSAVEEAWQAWADEWQARGDVVSRILLDDAGLNRRQYGKKAIEANWLPMLRRWAEAIDRLGPAEAMNAVSLPTWWKKLTPAGLDEGLKKNGRPIRDEFFTRCKEVQIGVEALSAARRARVVTLRRRFVEEARRAARTRREERHLLFFDDLLTELRAALRPPKGSRLAEVLRQRYRFALIDEFQDTDTVQYEIFRRVWHLERPAEAPGGLILIGDPKQAIYSFRGADVFTYLRAREDAGAEVYGLEVNWRSNTGLVDAVNELYGRPERAFGIDAIGFEPVRAREGAERLFEIPGRSGAGLRVLMADRSVLGEATDSTEEDAADAASTSALELRFGRTDLMRAIAKDVADLLDAGARIDGRPLVPRDIAILCRRNAELARARRALEALGIPCVDRGESDVFETREAWEMACVLRAMLRPGDPSALRAALSTGAHGLDASALEALGDDAPTLAAVGDRFAEYARIWSRSGLGRALAAWRRGESVTARLLELFDGERRLANWLHLAELLQRVEQDRAASRTGLVAWLENAIATPEARREIGSEASLLRLERDDDAVSLVTLHRSKGLQYEVVYLPCLWEDASPRVASEQVAKDESRLQSPIRFFDPETGSRTLDLGGPDYAKHAVLARDEELSEQLRLLYVGLTRAKRQCVVSWGAIGTHHASTPLAWLLHAPEWEAAGGERATSARDLKSWTDAQWRAAWQSLADAAEPGAVSIESADFGDRPAWRAPLRDATPLEFSPPQRAPSAPIVTTSFSALVREAQRPGESLSGPFVTGRDLDTNLGGDEAPDAVEESPDLAAAMHAFPKGAEAGTLLHEVLENLDFTDYDEAQVRSLAEAALDRNAFGREYVDQILHVVDSVATTPLRLEPRVLRLADLAPAQQRPEIEFTLAASRRDEGESFSPRTLGALLATAPADSPLALYAERAGRMGWRSLDGYLRGFIDSVFFDGERYFLIDYKSNHLGSRQADYRPERLLRPMIDHDYVLQYLIYVIALDRHLANRLEGYDYDEHFGGVYYLFLRGLAKSHEPGCGIFFDRPTADLVRRMSELIGRPGIGKGAA